MNIQIQESQPDQSLLTFINSLPSSFFCRWTRDTIKSMNRVDRWIWSDTVSKDILSWAKTQINAYVVDENEVLETIIARLDSSLKLFIDNGCVKMVPERGIIALLWIGLDGLLQSVGHFTEEEYQLKKKGILSQLEAIQKHREGLQESINKEKAYGTLLRNSVVTDISADSLHSGKKISELQELPFVVMSTDITAEVLCEVTPDKRHVYFESSLPMNLYPDWEVLYALNPSSEKV